MKIIIGYSNLNENFETNLPIGLTLRTERLEVSEESSELRKLRLEKRFHKNMWALHSQPCN